MTFPTIRTVTEQLKPFLPEGFLIEVNYSGSDDSGWFNNYNFTTKDGKYIHETSESITKAEAIIESALAAIHEELYKLLENRFPGWEIGDGHVIGSHGWFTINSNTRTISHNHIVDYNEKVDISTDEEVTF